MSRTHIAAERVDSDSSCMINIYVRLLADISELSGVPLGAPEEITDEWMLKTAPKLDKELLCFLEGSGQLPEFPEWLMPLLEVFLSSMDGKFLRWIRQLLLFCYKIEFEPTYEQLREAQASFEDTESGVACWGSHFENLNKSLLLTARQIVGKVIYRIDWSSIVPSHGPGAVYPPCLTHEKSDFRTIYPTIEQFYPYAEYFVGLPSFWDPVIVRGQDRIVESETIVSRLVAVPKDSRGPRLICVHPKEAIWIQQGCRRLLERAIESPRAPTHGRINFHDQSINGSLALSSSRDRGLCTLDLKEASDRISCELVRFLFGDYAYERMSCSRATHVRLLDDRVIALRKWAPMGNALTFPVQSLVFYALVRAGIRSHYGENCSDIYVFGDDILFPTKYYDGAIRSLVSCGLIPNVQKTFRHGFFRESCGVDAFNGINVTPHRIRRLDVRSDSGAVSLCTLAKALYIDGYRLTSDLLYRYISERFGTLPISNNPHAQGIYRYERCSFDKLLQYEKTLVFNKRHHKWQTRLLLVRGVNSLPHIDAWWHLQDSLLSISRKGYGELSDRGLEYAIPHRTRLTRGWADAL